MHRICMLMALLTRATAPAVKDTDKEDPQITHNPTATTPYPTTILWSNSRLFTSRVKSHIMRQGKADSPMLNYIFDSYATSNKHFHDKFRAPSFEGDKTTDDTIIYADMGSTVILDCRVSSLRDKMVSWLRVSENEKLELLTLDLETHTADFRYRVDLAGDNWKLSLSNAKVQDSGLYCCHVSTHPPMLKRFKLIVHAPDMKLPKETFLETGETLNLKCAVLHLYPGDHEPNMRWYRGNSNISIDEVRGGILVETDHLTLTSQLQVSRLRMEDAGNYTCALELPIKMRAVARVHVLQGSSLAELQSGVKTTSSYTSLLFSSIFILICSRFSDIR